MYQQILYDVLIRAYRIGIGLASPFKSKASLWVQGRKNWRERLNIWNKSSCSKVIWIHAASLGEFEQGRPVIEGLRSEFPEAKLLLTFFSPSGYEIRKEYNKVDHVCYLPLDTKRNARDFISIVRPALAIFIKYEFWFNHLNELYSSKIPTILVSGRLHAKQGFFKPWGGYFRKGLKAFDHFFIQNDESARLLDDIGLKNYTVNGDTRFDRVISIKEEDTEFHEVEEFCGDSPVVMVGSSWPYDEFLMQSYINRNTNKDFKVIFAPHEIDDKRMDEFAEKCSVQVLRLSKWNKRRGDEKVLFIDSIGMLSYLYRYATIAWIGGGFGAGIHNTLEAAVWSKPLVFGPRYQMFKEAIDLVENGAAFSFETQEEIDAMMNKLLFGDKKVKELAGQMAWRYCEVNKGATQQVLEYVSSLFKA